MQNSGLAVALAVKYYSAGAALPGAGHRILATARLAWTVMSEILQQSLQQHHIGITGGHGLRVIDRV